MQKSKSTSIIWQSVLRPQTFLFILTICKLSHWFRCEIPKICSSNKIGPKKSWPCNVHSSSKYHHIHLLFNQHLFSQFKVVPSSLARGFFLTPKCKKIILYTGASKILRPSLPNLPTSPGSENWSLWSLLTYIELGRVCEDGVKCWSRWFRGNCIGPI